MGKDFDKVYEGPRTERRAKRKKTNRILNMLIALVIILIVFFGGNLIFGDKNVEESVASNQTKQPAGNEGKATTKDSEDKGKETNTDDEQNNKEPSKESNKEQKEEPIEKNNEQKDPESDEAAVVTEGEPNSNIVKTVVNPAWKPIGTEQAEPHITNYDKGSVDRNEMEKAASYATGFDKEDMIVWWIGRSGGNSITATISSKTTKQVQRVYLDWVPNEGWKPTKVEELKENDTETYKKHANESDTDEDD